MSQRAPAKHENRAGWVRAGMGPRPYIDFLAIFVLKGEHPRNLLGEKEDEFLHQMVRVIRLLGLP